MVYPFISKLPRKWCHLLMGILLLFLLPNEARAQSWPWALTIAEVTFDVVALDAQGNAVVAGQFGYGGNQGVTVAFGATTLVGPASFVGWLSPTGKWLQVVRAETQKFTAIAVDAAGNVTVGGWFNSSTARFGNFTLTRSAGPIGATHAFVARLSRAGVWAYAVQAEGSTGDMVSALAIDNAGGTAVTGTFISDVLRFGNLQIANSNPGSPNTDFFVARLSSSGTWIQAVGVGGEREDIPVGIAVEADGTATVVGSFTSTALNFGTGRLPNSIAGTRDIFVARLDPAGQWRQVVAGGSNGDEGAAAFGLLPTGEVVVAGSFTGEAQFGNITLPDADRTFATCDVFVARLSRSGTWTKAYRAGGPDFDVVSTMVLDGLGNATITGYFYSPTITFGETTLINTGSAAGFTHSSDIFVATLKGDNWVQAVNAGGTVDDETHAIAVDNSGNATLLGSFHNKSIALGPTTITNFTQFSRQEFVARLAATAPTENTLALFPNPAHSQFFLTFQPATDVMLYDALGRLVRTFIALPTIPLFDLSGLAPGLYMVRCGAASGKLVVE